MQQYMNTVSRVFFKKLLTGGAAVTFSSSWLKFMEEENIKLDGLVSPNLYKKTRYINPIEVAQETESILKNRYNCNLVICLSHLGYKYDNEQVSDALVAANTLHTDIIVGGHTHDVLDPVAKIKNSTGKPVYIGQAGYSGVKIGRMEVYFNKENQQILVETNTTKIQKNQVV